MTAREPVCKKRSLRLAAMLTAVLALLAIASVAPVGAQTRGQHSCPEDQSCWTIRGFLLDVDADDSARDSRLRPNDVPEASKFSLGSGEGLGAEAEYHFTDRIGLGFGVGFADLDTNFELDVGTEWGMQDKDLGLTMLFAGPNFHLTPNSRTDFYIGPVVAMLDYDNVSYGVLGETHNLDFDNEFAVGLRLGLDVPLRRNNWALHLGAGYLAGQAEAMSGDREYEVDADPLTLSLSGLAYSPRFKKKQPPTVDGPITVPAPVTPVVTLDVRVQPAGGGRVNGNGIDCPPDCSEQYTGGDNVALTGEPASGYLLDSWNGCDAASGDRCNVTMDTDKSVVASFAREAAPAAPTPVSEPEPEVVYFDYGSSRVSNIGKAKLDEVALRLQQESSLHAHIVGHSDSRGPESANQRRSVERAESVKRYLVDRHGIDSGRITTEGKGSTEPVATNDTHEGRAQNRRAVIYLKAQ